MSELLNPTQEVPVLERAHFPDYLGMTLARQGKARDVFRLPGGLLALVATDRISAFDTVLGTVPDKGAALNGISAFWFHETADIIPNHLVAVPDPNIMIVKEARPLPVEVVVRGYMTGSTDTSIWGSYQRGERIIYGLPFREGYRKNDPLDFPIITPTTKAETGHDERLTEAEIVRSGLVQVHVWQQVREAALKVFARGQQLAKAHGFILFDTKFEFGLTPSGQVILIDEVLTPDSSRFARQDTFADRIAGGLEPEFYDKEVLRLSYRGMGYKGDGDPPPLPPELRRQVADRYAEIYHTLTGSQLPLPSGEINSRMAAAMSRWLLTCERERMSRQKVVIIMGSAGDREHTTKITAVLDELGIHYLVRVASAHKTPEHLLKVVREQERVGESVIFIAVAGRSNALGGVIDANTRFPVINAPPPGTEQTIWSSLEMPSGVGAVTVIYPEAAALAAAKIMSIGNPELSERIRNYQELNRERVLSADNSSSNKLNP